MKNKNARKKEYYIHQIVRSKDLSNQQVENTDNSTVVYNVKNRVNYAENVGYHLDPSRYDSLRSRKVNNKPVQIEKEEVIEVPINTPMFDSDAYYAAMADSYVEESDETVISEIIREDEIEETITIKPEKPIVEKETIVNKTSEPAVVKSNKPRVSKRNKYVAPSLDFLTKGGGTSDKDVTLAEEQKDKINEILEKYGIKKFTPKFINDYNEFAKTFAKA